MAGDAARAREIAKTPNKQTRAIDREKLSCKMSPFDMRKRFSRSAGAEAAAADVVALKLHLTASAAGI